MLPVLDEELGKARIARRIALEFNDGDVVNLGIGIPTLVSDYVPVGIRIIFQTENGIIGAGPRPKVEDWRFIGAGGRSLSLFAGSSLVASDFSFGLIRGGHLDYTVLGALQVDEEGNLANWWIPGQLVPGMGGAMDLVTGVKNVIIATSLTNKTGEAKLVKKCTLPLTGVRVVNMVVTEYCVMRFNNRRMILHELAPDVKIDDLRKAIEADFLISDSLYPMKGAENG